MPSDSFKNYQHSIMGKKIPDVGGNTANVSKRPGEVGGNTPNATKPGKQTQIGGNYVPGKGMD